MNIWVQMNIDMGGVLDVEFEFYDVAVLHDIGFTF